MRDLLHLVAALSGHVTLDDVDASPLDQRWRINESTWTGLIDRGLVTERRTPPGGQPYHQITDRGRAWATVHEPTPDYLMPFVIRALAARDTPIKEYAR